MSTDGIGIIFVGAVLTVVTVLAIVLITQKQVYKGVCEAANAVLVADHYCLPKSQLLDLED